jgi:hypothetical protein
MVAFNPFVITNASDSFSVQSQGFYQGDVQADPATRFAIAAANIASTEALPMWGGIAVYEATPPAQTVTSGGFNGSIIGRAVNNSLIAGFSVNNGSNSAPTTPQSPVPLQSAGFGFNFVRMGSGNRVVVQASTGILALAGSDNPQQFSWDTVNELLLPYTPLSGSAEANTSIVWLGGIATVVCTAHGFVTGNYVTIAGAAPVGYNVSGPVTVIDANTFTIAMPINPGVETVPGTSQLGLGGFNATLVSINAGNSAIVSYNASTGFATWNNSGNAAVILI